MQNSDSGNTKIVLNPTPYLSYMVRLWLTPDNFTWRVSVEKLGAAGRLGFANLADFFAFLEQETAVHTSDDQ